MKNGMLPKQEYKLTNLYLQTTKVYNRYLNTNKL